MQSLTTIISYPPFWKKKKKRKRQNLELIMEVKLILPFVVLPLSTSPLQFQISSLLKQLSLLQTRLWRGLLESCLEKEQKLNFIIKSRLQNYPWHKQEDLCRCVEPGRPNVVNRLTEWLTYWLSGSLCSWRFQLGALKRWTAKMGKARQRQTFSTESFIITFIFHCKSEKVM